MKFDITPAISNNISFAISGSYSISEDEAKCVQSIVKKVKQDQSFKWKKVCNEKRFKFNESVEASFESAIAAY